MPVQHTSGHRHHQQPFEILILYLRSIMAYYCKKMHCTAEISHARARAVSLVARSQ